MKQQSGACRRAQWRECREVLGERVANGLVELWTHPVIHPKLAMLGQGGNGVGAIVYYRCVFFIWEGIFCLLQPTKQSERR